MSTSGIEACPQPVAAETAAPAAPLKIRVGFIVGATGAGKSALAIDIAERLDAEIVNADSRQAYCGMDIGTAKPMARDLGRVAHHLINVRRPAEPLDVVEFIALAHAAIADVTRRGRRALVVGGSGLYLRALRQGIFRGPAASEAIRAELTAVAEQRGTPYLHAILEDRDPAAAARIGRHDRYRIIRALEVLRLTGIPISEHQRRHAFAGRRYRTLTVGIALPREQLYAVTDRRLDDMMAAGLLDEVRGLLADDEAGKSVARKSIGYRHLAAHLRGELELAAALELAKRETRRLAKRQLTWFRADAEIVWVDAAQAREQAFALFERFFEHGEGGNG